MDVEDFGLSYARFIFDDRNNPYSQLTGNFYPVQHHPPSPLEPTGRDPRNSDFLTTMQQRHIPGYSVSPVSYFPTVNSTSYQGYPSTSPASYVAPAAGVGQFSTDTGAYGNQFFAPSFGNVPEVAQYISQPSSESTKTSSDFWNDVVSVLESAKADGQNAPQSTFDSLVNPGQPNNPLPERIPSSPNPTLETTSLPSDTSPQLQEPSSPTHRFLTDDERWDALTTRDPLAEGHFFYCVLSTHIYCRPVCPARRPARNNVAFVKTIAEAEALGCRPCKRCKPNESIDPTIKRQTDVVERLKKALLNELGAAGSEQAMTVKGIAEEMGVSMWHLNRLFKSKVGMPPKAWAQAQRRERTAR